MNNVLLFCLCLFLLPGTDGLFHTRPHSHAPGSFRIAEYFPDLTRSPHFCFFPPTDIPSGNNAPLSLALFIPDQENAHNQNQWQQKSGCDKRKQNFIPKILSPLPHTLPKFTSHHTLPISFNDGITITMRE
nr:hypothetical protein [Proteus mirabilis]